MTEPVNQPFSAADIQRLVDEAVQRATADMEKKHQQEMTELRTALAGVQPSPVATHAGGPGTEIAETWSGYDQALATRGEHPWQNGENADWLSHPDRREFNAKTRTMQPT